MRLRSTLSAIALCVITSGAGVVAATAPANADSMATTAKVTVVHGIPNVPVTVYANNKVLIKDFKFGTVVGPVSLKPGKYALAIRPFGAAATSKPILAASVSVVAGENATVEANLTAAGKPTLSVFANPTTAYGMGMARVIVRHTAQAPGVDVYAGPTSKAALISNLLNGKSATANVPAGSYTIGVYVHGTKTNPAIGPAKFAFKAGTTYVIYAIGSATAKPATITVAVQQYK
jgi:hypothetical protein